MIKNLIFDFGKVLVNHDLQPLLERHFGDDEVSLIGFHKILSDPEFINMCDRGIIPFEKMIDGAIKSILNIAMPSRFSRIIILKR